MKTFFLKNKTLILTGFTALLFSIIALYQCSEKRAEIKSIEAQQDKKYIEISNQVQSYYLLRENKKIDSIKQAESIKTFKAHTDALIYKAEAYRLKQKSTDLEKKYNQFVAENALCPDLLKAAIIRIDTLKAENFMLEKAIEKVDIEAEGYSRQLYLSELQRSNIDTLLVSARKEVKAGDLVITSLKKVDKKKESSDKVIKLIGGGVILFETVLLIIKGI